MTTERRGDVLSVPVGDQDHIRGPADAPVTLVEYGDFECPFCGRAYPAVERLIEQLGSRLRFVFRHFPRPEHPHARHAAEAAEAAAAQGEERFWDMYNQLFQHQQALDDASLARYAVEIGLDVPRFQRDLAEHVYLERVQADLQSGVHSGAHGTPTFFVNSRKHEGPDTYDDLMAAVQAELGTAASVDPVTEASEESFPASDAPGWIKEEL
jgi:protein-disulfide isomerase